MASFGTSPSSPAAAIASHARYSSSAPGNSFYGELRSQSAYSSPVGGYATANSFSLSQRQRFRTHSAGSERPSPLALSRSMPHHSPAALPMAAYDAMAASGSAPQPPPLPPPFPGHRKRYRSADSTTAAVVSGDEFAMADAHLPRRSLAGRVGPVAALTGGGFDTSDRSIRRRYNEEADGVYDQLVRSRRPGVGVPGANFEAEEREIALLESRAASRHVITPVSSSLGKRSVGTSTPPQTCDAATSMSFANGNNNHHAGNHASGSKRATGNGRVQARSGNGRDARQLPQAPATSRNPVSKSTDNPQPPPQPPQQQQLPQIDKAALDKLISDELRRRFDSGVALGAAASYLAQSGVPTAANSAERAGNI